MSIEDKERWNEKYQTSFLPQTIIEVVEQYAKEAKGTKALDLACGMGRNAKLLVEMGFKVDAVDISDVAIATLEGIENINAQVADLETYELKEDAYDLIVCTYYLERTLFPKIESALKKDGILIVETFLHDKANTKEPSNRAFLLEKNELEKLLEPHYEILYHQEFMAEVACAKKCMKISMVSRKR